MKIKIMTALLAGLLLFSCKSNSTLLLDTISEKDLDQLNSAEYHLMDYSLNGDEKKLVSAGKILKTLSNKKTANQEFSARLLMLETELRIRSSSTSLRLESEEAIKTAHKSNPHEERIAIVQSLLARKPLEKRQLLMQYSEKPRASRVYFELGVMDYNQGHYLEAVKWFEKAEQSLPPLFHPLFQELMDNALRLIEPDDDSINTILIKNQLTVTDIIEVLNKKTPLITYVSTRSVPEQILDDLIKNGYIHDKTLTGESAVQRKEAAGLIASLLTHFRQEPSLLIESGQYYIDSGIGSPVKDVATGDWFFYSVILLLELEVMDLPDGLNFFPERIVRGKEMQESLSALDKLIKNR